MNLCAHCNQPKEDFEPLADGTPSVCCTDCWRAFKERYDLDVNDPAWWAAQAEARLVRQRAQKNGKRKGNIVALEDYRQ